MTELIDGRYELIEVIASGGMATVWRARDTRLDRMVALKRPHPAPNSDEATHRRMDREARAAASLNHPNVVTVYDYGQDDAGPWLVMELAEGPTLEHVAREAGGAPAAETGALLAGALAAIHAAGIIHRDVKPANVIMSERGPLLTDFGIAFVPATGTQITDPGKIVVTPSYAAPEVLAGGSPTPASDVYALAVVVAELATGEHLFTGFERPTAPPHLADESLDRALGAALSPDPSERPSAAELAAGLWGAAPTTSTISAPVAAGATLVMDTPVVADIVAPSVAPAASTEEGWRWLLAGLLVGALVFLLATQGPAGDDTPVAGAGLPPGSESTTAAPAPSTTTTAASTTTTVPPSTTMADRVLEVRDRLQEILAEPPRDDFSLAEVEKLMETVDEAILAARAGDESHAGDLLREVAAKLGKKELRQERRRAEQALAELADLLGVQLDDDQGRGGGDDD